MCRLKRQNSPAGALQIRKPGVQGGALLIQLRNATAQLANLSHQPRVIRQHVLYSLGIRPTGCIEPCLLDQVGRDIYGNGPRIIDVTLNRAGSLQHYPDTIKRNVTHYAKPLVAPPGARRVFRVRNNHNAGA